MRIRLGILVLFSFFWVLPSGVRAHPMLDRAVAAYEEADFKTALRTFNAAARNADLSVEELLQLFEMRALVHHAIGDYAAMRDDLYRLVAVRPSYRLGRLAPPPVRTAFDEVIEANRKSGGVELRIEEKAIDGAPSMVARVLRVPDALVDHVTLQCNVGSNNKTISRTSQGTKTRVKLPESGRHNGCSATARTRQGGVLFSASIDDPGPLPQPDSKVFQIPEYQPPTQPQADTSSTKKKKKWPWFVAAAGVVVAGGVTAGLILSQRSNESQPATGGVTVNW